MVNIIILYCSKFAYYQYINLKTIHFYLWSNFYKDMCLSNINIGIQEKSQYTILPSTKSIKYITSLVKSTLYHRNKKGFWKINNQVNVSKILSFSNKLLDSWYFYYLNIVDNFCKNTMINNINMTLYLWQRKKQK